MVFSGRGELGWVWGGRCVVEGELRVSVLVAGYGYVVRVSCGLC